jgi:hypothetical protein
MVTSRDERRPVSSSGRMTTSRVRFMFGFAEAKGRGKGFQHWRTHLPRTTGAPYSTGNGLAREPGPGTRVEERPRFVARHVWKRSTSVPPAAWLVPTDIQPLTHAQPRCFASFTLARGDGSFRHLLAGSAVSMSSWSMTGQWRRSLKRNVGTSGECGEERDQTGSVMLASQMPVARWHEQIGDPTVATAPRPARA